MNTDTDLAARPVPVTREPLTRDRILGAALAYIDEHGLDALSMHKLGAALGVKAMSLYNHVAGKDDMLDGVVEALWAEVEAAAPVMPDWRDGVRGLARGIRATVHRHPHAASLIGGRAVVPAPALRSVRDHVTTTVKGGLPEPSAYALLRTIVTYALGTAQAEVRWGGIGDPATPRQPTVADLLRPNVPDDLAEVAEVFCGQANLDAQFELGLDLMLLGIDRAGCVGTARPAETPIEGDDPAAGRGLGRADRDGVAVGDALLPDHDDPGVEVHVGPAQPGGLAAAQPAQRDQPPHGE